VDHGGRVEQPSERRSRLLRERRPEGHTRQQETDQDAGSIDVHVVFVAVFRLGRVAADAALSRALSMNTVAGARPVMAAAAGVHHPLIVG
jgi:hypothetical protein